LSICQTLLNLCYRSRHRWYHSMTLGTR
jgi:hypothetical protein